MENKGLEIKWFWVYFKIRRGLYSHFQNCKENGTNPGQELYKKFNNSVEFINENSWFEKFSIENSFDSIDPIHVFASISSNKLSEKRRIRRIQILLELLDLNAVDKSIDFEGCPTPTAIMLLGGRKNEVQSQIWSFFARIHLNSLKGLTQTDFNNFKNWHGIDFSSFTQFLFWFASDDFLPIEKNVRTFLVATKIVKDVPDKFLDYINLLNKIKDSEYSENEKYGPNGLIREITYVAYQTISEGKNEISNTISFHNWHVENKISDIESNSGEPDLMNEIPKELNKSTEQENVNNENLNSDLDDISEISKLGFKLIAIKPLKECSKSHLNILNKEETYYFEKTIELKDEITYFPERNIDLFSSKNGIKLNFTAIVGKNGSGKSSIIELLFMAFNNIAFINRVSLNTKRLSFVNGLFVELHYINNGYLYKITLKNRDITWEEFELRGNRFIKTSSPKKFNKEFFDCFFYSIAVNYSHYALNSDLIGIWIQGLFHKNDGYQTPLVINPMRTHGKIDINDENELVKSRFLSNLLLPVENKEDLGFRKLTERQTAEKVEFKFNSDKTFFVYKDEKKKKEVFFSDLSFDKAEIYDLILEVYSFTDKYKKVTPKVIKIAKEYIIKKLIRIAVTYPQYSKFYDREKDVFINSIETRKFLEKLKNDSSHVTFKLKQAINYWKYPLLWPKKQNFKVNLKDQSDKLQIFMNAAEAKNINDFLAPPIFNFQILISDSSTDSSELVEFEKMSSGEKQFIHSASSILYHIKNIDSIQYQRGRVSYTMINVILDEIELYYHPELQRRYIADFIALLNRIDLNRIEAINFLLVTHSPYILSDIPDNFTMRLKDGNQQFDQQKTFGSNVHDLLANDFFMENGFMGEWAKEKIISITDYLTNLLDPIESYVNTDDWNSDEALKFIDIIGEPLIRNSLKDLFFNSQGKNSIEREIKRLQALISN